MKTNEELKAFLESKLANLKKLLVDEDFGVTYDSFYEIGLDEYGMPHSHGNSDDVYSDGFSNGVDEGEENAFTEVMKFMGWTK